MVQERVLIHILIATALLSGFIMLEGTGTVDVFRADAGVTGLISGDFGTQEEFAAPVLNQPPAYTGPASLSTQQDTALTIDLAMLFTDPEGDTLTFLVAEEDIISVSLDGSIATFTPAPGFAGERTMTLVASDAVNLVRQPVKFVVEGAFAAEPIAAEEPAQPTAPEEEPVQQPEEPAPNEPTTGFGPQEFTIAEDFEVNNITQCGTINTSVRLTTNISSNGTCISFNNHSIFLDCAGFTITYGVNATLNNSWGVNVTSFQNATVTNCTIVRGNPPPSAVSRQNGTRGYGVSLVNASFARVENNTILTNGTGENDGIHTSGTGSVRVEIVTNNGNVNTPYCVNGTGSSVVSCRTCFANSAVNCAVYGQKGCTDGRYPPAETIVTFNINAGSIPTQGRVTILAGEWLTCHMNGVQFVQRFLRNVCGALVSTTIPGSLFVAGQNNMSCEVSGSGKDEDNGFKLSAFSYDVPAVIDRGVNLTIRNNTIIAAGGNNSYGIYMDNGNSTIANNTITTNGTNLGHGIFLAAGADSNIIANNTITVRPSGSDAIRAVGALRNTFLNNSIVNFTRAAIHLENALNNTFNQTDIPFFARRGSLFIQETDGSINFTESISFTNRTTLADIINLTLNATRVNTSVFGGQQLNRSAILEFFGMPFFGSRPVFDAEDDVSFAVCNDPRCSGSDYNISRRVMRFNVSSFTTYASSELSVCETLDEEFNVTSTTYTLINNVSSTGTCFTVVGDNITLDCGGFAVYYGGGGGSNSIGVDISLAGNNTRNTTVRNCVIIKNGTSGSDSHGVAMRDTTFVTLQNTNITTRSNRSHAVFMVNSVNVTIASATLLSEEDALRVDGDEPAHWSTHEINASNIANGLNISYFGGSGTSPACPNNAVLTRPITQHITLIRCTGVTLNDFNSSDRLTIVDSNYTNVSNSNFRNNSRGIAVFFSPHTTIANNTITTVRGSQTYPVHLRHTNFTNVTFNRIQTSGTQSGYGILLETRSYVNNISNNNITTNGTADNVGIVVGTSAQNILQGNNITTNGSGSGNKGIVLNATSENNSVIANRISTNGSSSNGGIEANGSNNNITSNVIRTSSSNFANFNFGIGVQNGVNNDVSFNDIETSGTGDAANGINVTNLNNSRFINNTIHATGSDTLRGIWVRVNSNNNLFHNNTIRTEAFFGTPSYGIELNTNASNNSVMGNNITTNGTSSDYGVYVFLSDRTTIAYNTIRTQSGNVGNGIDIDGDTGPSVFSDYTFIVGNNITAGHGAGSNTGVEIEEARFVVIENNTISVNSSTGSSNVGMDVSSFSFRVNVTGNRFTTQGGTGGGNIGIDFGSMGNGTAQHNIVVTNGGSNSDGYSATGDNNTINNNTFFIHATGSRGLSIGGTSATAVRNLTSAFIGNSIHVNSTDSVGISILGLAFPERHVFNHTALNVTGTWIQAEGGSGTRIQGNFSLNFTNTTFLSENGSIRIPGSFILNFSQVRINWSNLNITRNRAFMNATNTTYLKNNTNDTVHMNQSAQITLRGIGVTIALPTVDFEDDGTFATCSSPQCVEVSYANGVFVFNVSGFTTYSSTEGGLNVSLTKLDSPDPVNASGFLNYTITINVSSANNASNITLTDLYPSQIIFLSASPSPTNGNNTFIIGNLTNGSSFSVNISVLVNNGTAGVTLNNTANISFQNSTGSLLFFNVTENTTVTAAAGPSNLTNLSNLTITKTDLPDPVNATSLLNYTIFVNSTGNGTSYNVTVTETYPPHVAFNASQPAPLTGTNNTFVLGNLTAGTNFAINLTVTVLNWVSNSTVINNTVTAGFQNETSQSVINRTATIGTTVLNPNITNSFIANCTIINSTIRDSTKINCTIINSQVFGSNNTNSTLLNSTETNSTDTNALVQNSNITGAIKTNSTINQSVITNSTIINGTLTNSTANNSNVTNCIVINSTVLNSVKANCTIINSNIIGSVNSNATIINSNETNSNDTNTVVDRGIITLSVKTGSTVNNSNLTRSNLTNTTFTNSTAVNSNLTNCIVINSTILDSNKVNCTIINSNIINSTNRNATIISSNETGSTDTDTTIDFSIITGTVKDGSTINRTNTTNSNVTDSILINDTIINSTIINSNLTNCTVINSTIESVVNSSCVYGNTTINLTAVPAPPTPPPAAGQGGGGGGRGGGPGGAPAVQQPAPVAEEAARPCVETWVCSEWGTCERGQQERGCSDGSECGTEERKPETSRACAVEQPPAVEQPLVAPQLKPAIDLFKARLWPLIIAIITLALLTGAYIHHQHRQPPAHVSLPRIRLPVPARTGKPVRALPRQVLPKVPAELRAIAAMNSKQFGKAVDAIDQKIKDLDRGRLPPAVRQKVEEFKAKQRNIQESAPLKKPELAVKEQKPAEPPKRQKPRKPGLFARIFTPPAPRLSEPAKAVKPAVLPKVVVPAPKPIAIPKPKPAQIKPVVIPPVVVKPVRHGADSDGVRFKHKLDSIDAQLARLDKGRLPAAVRKKIVPEKAREQQRKPEPAIPAPKPALPKPVPQAKPLPAPKPVRVPSIDDVRRLALEEIARRKPFKDKERFKKKMDRIDEQLNALDKNSRKRKR